MPRDFHSVVALIEDMQKSQSVMNSKMREVLNRYEGDWVIPMPSVVNEPTLPPLTPALIGEAVDSMAQRAASVRPRVVSPALEPNKATGQRSVGYATTRRKMISAVYHQSKWGLGRRRYLRQLAAYNTASLVVLPSFKKGYEMPRLEVRDPLGTFVEPQSAEELCPPGYIAYINTHSGQKLRKIFPEVRGEQGGPISDQNTAELWEVFEWIDEDQVMFGLMGPVHKGGRNVDHRWRGAAQIQLGPSTPNRAGLVPGICPRSVALGAVASRLASMIGNVDLQAKLVALDILAQEKAIFPDMYIIGRRDGGMPTLVNGPWKDGREGEPNLLMDTESLGLLRSTPDVRTSQSVDRLERNFRISTGLPPQVGGETYGALRTGRGIDALTGVSLDPRIQELHETDEAWMSHINSAILATYKGYWPNKQFSLYSGWPTDKGLVEFTPAIHVETLENVVSYPIPGADVIQLTQILGSLYGSKMMSLETSRTKHPWIEDPEEEAELVQVEQFEEAMFATVMQQMTQGQIPLPAATMLVEEIRKGHDIFKAMTNVDKKMKELQAQQAPPPELGQIAAPETMPGMAGGPGALQQQGEQLALPPGAPPGPPPGPDGGAAGMRQLMEAMAAQGGGNAP